MTKEEVREVLGFDEEQNFDSVSIAVASPDTIRRWSKGEVKNPETINYRTFKPESGGLFCQRIFGPVKDYECACGKYKRIKYKGVVCDRCGVEVTLSRVRREWMGHINLAVPVAHVWFLKTMPSRFGLLLEMTMRDLEKVVYYENYIVIDAGRTSLEEKQLLTEQEYQMAQEEFGEDAFVAKMGAEAIKDLLSQIDLSAEVESMQMEIYNTRSKQIKKKLAKRLKMMNGFLQSGTRPEWMVLDVIPVIPPDLRPLIPLEGGRFATSDLNDLYRRVINRNNRLRNLLQLKTPDVIIHNEKRMLQEAVDALFDNGCHGARPVTGSGNRPLKSLSDMLKGKQGRFRQNLLGKRVDYSGRSVIVIGPDLKLHQCGLPKKMALILFEPFIIRRLKELGFAHTVRSARKLIENKAPEVWDILAEVTKGHPVLLNRAPSLHRLSIQAFEPVLIEGDAIRLHPLVCSAFNADFDGDQMAVHVPLSTEAIMEARLLMLSTNNMFAPSSGKPVLTPSQDIVLGIYYLTLNLTEKPAKLVRVPVVSGIQEALMAQAEGMLTLHDWIDMPNPDYGRQTQFGNRDVKFIRTTIGRTVFNTIWPTSMGFINEPVGKNKLSELIALSYNLVDRLEAVHVLDSLKQMGFLTATKIGASISIDDMVVPKEKSIIIEKSRKKIKEVESQFKKGIITNGERCNKVIDIWTSATDEIAKMAFKGLEGARDGEVNSVYMMMDSGARGNRQQVRQLCGARGLMAKPSGEIIEQPILSSFREGLNVLEYFISTHGARKGMADTALKTADAGYLTRKLCDVAMDCVIVPDTDNLDYNKGIWKQAIYEGDEEIVKLSERIVGRCSCENVVNPINPEEVIIHRGEIITRKMAEWVEEMGIVRVKVLSPLTHMNKDCIPAKAYGLDPSTHHLVEEGTSVGIIAAQSIGEPGTQLTMRTFHVGGVASQVLKSPESRVRHSGRVKYNGLRTVKTADNATIVLNKTGTVCIVDDEGREVETVHIFAGSLLTVADGDFIESGSVLTMWDPHNIPILSEKGGIVRFKDMMSGITIRRAVDDSSSQITSVVIEHQEDLNPSIEIMDKKDAHKVLATYAIPVGAQIVVNVGDEIYPGALLAKTPRSASRTQDITGGLPRVAELFEARRPKDASEIAKIEGIVSVASGMVRGKKRLLITNPETEENEEHLIPHGKQLIVYPGDLVKKGQCLTEGAADPHEILTVLGVHALQEYLLTEIQKVYRLQGVTIDDKHLEVIIARMLSKVRVTDPGDTDYFWGEQVDRMDFLNANEKVLTAGGKPAEGEPILLGITKASLETDSFISAASFQETTRVLTEAATLGKTDTLKGFKENVIMGNLIPAGTGMAKYRRMTIRSLCEPTNESECKGEE
ncbi:MAG: DNA-directed RNA polymerase subunit beta' [Puniceicoccales bacterium]|jgi:DNA-directed RNA polymerase subunit beta'|nr:DNA-directed RNA polymerase subunit beta' [Puniceicoccales bacterium]